MKIKYLVMYMDGGRSSEDSRHDTYEEAEAKIMSMNVEGVLGTVEFYIRKIYTNSEK